MKHSDLNVDLHGIALANGLPSGITAHPAFKAFMSEYKVALAALVLEKAADVIRDECLSGDQSSRELRTMAAALQSGETSGGVK